MKDLRKNAIQAVLIIASFIKIIEAKCPKEALAPLPFVLEYALWKGWFQVTIFTPHVEPGCTWAILRLVKCLSLNGVGSIVNSTSSRAQYRLGIVVLSPRLSANNSLALASLLEELHKLQMNSASYDWLVTMRSEQDSKQINKMLNKTSIRFDQNIVVSYLSNKNLSGNPLKSLCENNFSYKSSNHLSKRTIIHKLNYDLKRNTHNFEQDLNSGYKLNDGYFRSSQRFKNLARNRTYSRFGKEFPIYNSGATNFNYSKAFQMTNISKFSLRRSFQQRSHIYNLETSSASAILHLVQYFKVRVNSTLYAHYLGVWSDETSMSHIDVPYPVESRNFLREEMLVGRYNSSGGGVPSLDDEGPSAPASLDDVLHFITVRLNTTPSPRYYSKLGFRTYEGAWTGLLGALMDNSVDIALEPVTAHTARHQDMDFIFPIAETMYNIYIRQQETSTVRDIFLAPFSARLIACVVAIAVVAAVALVVIAKLGPLSDDHRHVGCTEAIIWATGILCQQGGTWTPPNAAASILLIVCLFFAVVTYNAYAAFITSVLSVRVASVDTVAAVLRSPDFKIGYIKNGADQMYLMSTKDVQLNAFYIRGYSDAENLVLSAEEGLARAASQDYAFFAGQRAARSTLRSLSQARGRCAVREVPVHSTRAQLAFPLPRHSPYARPMLLSLLQLRSGGSLARLEAALVPDMPHCAPPPGFASARATDVRSALVLLLLGYILAIIIGFLEYSWKHRKEINIFFVKCYGRLLKFFK